MLLNMKYLIVIIGMLSFVTSFFGPKYVKYALNKIIYNKILNQKVIKTSHTNKLNIKTSEYVDLLLVCNLEYRIVNPIKFFNKKDLIGLVIFNAIYDNLESYKYIQLKEDIGSTDENIYNVQKLRIVGDNELFFTNGLPNQEEKILFVNSEIFRKKIQYAVYGELYNNIGIFLGFLDLDAKISE